MVIPRSLRSSVELRHATPLALSLRRAKLTGLRVRRLARWLVDRELAPPQRVVPHGPIAHQIRIAIARSGADLRLEAGKRHNVRLAATAFHGIVVTPGRPLSFWRALGPATQQRGFSWGMELRSGCAVPAIGGGLCLISNALFALAVELGWRILERHGHSMALGDPTALDATVAYPHIDLRVAPRAGSAMLDVTVRGDVLTVAARGQSAPLEVDLERTQHDDGRVRETRIRRRVWSDRELVEDALIVDDRQRIPVALRTCLDCGEVACHARVEIPEAAR